MSDSPGTDSAAYVGLGVTCAITGVLAAYSASTTHLTKLPVYKRNTASLSAVHCVRFGISQALHLQLKSRNGTSLKLLNNGNNKSKQRHFESHSNKGDGMRCLIVTLSSSALLCCMFHARPGAVSSAGIAGPCWTQASCSSPAVVV